MNCLILIGGKSSRMGTDKSLLDYHGKPQREYLFDLAQKFCLETYFSCRAEQVFSENTIVDINPSGPISGILSAFEFNKNVAWLIVACDMPFIDETSFELLIQNRNQEKKATAFLNTENNAPDPLFTIYEPTSFEILSTQLETGNKSPKYFLQNNDIELVKLPKISFLKNINTKEEFDSMWNETPTSFDS
jgi:molybdenum cofactor guanylyltransferase